MGLFGKSRVDETLKEEKTQEELQKEAQARREQTSKTIRLLAGLYLCYLSYNMLKGLIEGTSDPVSQPWIIWTAAIAFGVIGLGLVGWYLWRYTQETRRKDK